MWCLCNVAVIFCEKRSRNAGVELITFQWYIACVEIEGSKSTQLQKRQWSNKGQTIALYSWYFFPCIIKVNVSINGFKLIFRQYLYCMSANFVISMTQYSITTLWASLPKCNCPEDKSMPCGVSMFVVRLINHHTSLPEVYIQICVIYSSIYLSYERIGMGTILLKANGKRNGHVIWLFTYLLIIYKYTRTRVSFYVLEKMTQTK